MSTDSSGKAFFSIEEVADLLGVNYQLIYKLVRDGEIPASRIGRVYRVAKSDLDNYLARAKTASVTAFTCGACGKDFGSRQSQNGTCEACDATICFDCWSRKNMRVCAEHGKVDGVR